MSKLNLGSSRIGCFWRLHTAIVSVNLYPTPESRLSVGICTPAQSADCLNPLLRLSWTLGNEFAVNMGQRCTVHLQPNKVLFGICPDGLCHTSGKQA